MKDQEARNDIEDLQQSIAALRKDYWSLATRIGLIYKQIGVKEETRPEQIVLISTKSSTTTGK